MGSTEASLVPTDTLATRRRSLLRLAPVLGSHRGEFVLALLANLGAQGGAVVAAVAGAWMVGSAASGGAVGELAVPGAVLAAAVVVRVASVWAESWIAHDLAYRIMAGIRVGLFDGLERLAPGRLLGKRTGDLAGAAMADVESLEWFYAHAVAQFAVTVSTPVAAVGAMAVVDWRLAVTLAPFVAAVVTVPLWLARLADRQGEALRARLGELHADAVDGVQGLRELVSFGAADGYRQRLLDRSRRLTTAQQAHGSRSGMEGAASDALVAAAMVAVLAIAAGLVAADRLEGSLFPVVVVLAFTSLGPVTEVVGGIRNLGVLRAAASRVFSVVDAPAHVADAPDAAETVAEPTPGVRFDHVRFSYGPGLPDVLVDVDFEVPPGQTVALVGRSGAGKSTCAHLLVRFWDVTGGAVRVGGVDVRSLTQAGLRDAVSLVPQDAYLFNMSIADNIRLARPAAGDAEVREAASKAQVTEFADDLPEGLDTVVGERGAMLSGGQRQRIAIARALVRDTRVLVLDEAVSNVDAHGERLLHRALEEATAGRTTLVIAHRLSTIRRADRVVMLDGGRVVADGPHDELAATSEPYRRLLATQLDEVGAS